MALIPSNYDVRFAPVEAVRQVRAIAKQPQEKDTGPLGARADERNSQSQRFGFLRQQTQQEERAALAEIAPVRAFLSPSDEAALFGGANEISVPVETAQQLRAGEATAADGSPVVVDIITARDGRAEQSLIPLYIQSAGARIYARYQEAVFAVDFRTPVAA